MNIRNWAKKLNICAVAGAMLLTFTSANAETIVHTTRYNYDADNYANSVENATALTATAKAKQKNNATNKKEPTPRRPVPYTFAQAIDYAEMYPEDITVHRIHGIKDKYGNFGNWLFLDFLRRKGLNNAGNAFWGFPEQTFLRVTLHFGQEINPQEPFAMLSWGADLNKLNKLTRRAPMVSAKYRPISLKIVFESGYEKEFLIDPNDIGKCSHLLFGFLFIRVGHYYGSNIELTREDIWDIYKHGNIANVYIENGLGTGDISFFYSGEKQEEHKQQLTYGFEHMVRLLNINPATLAYERKRREDAEKKRYSDKVRSQVKDELYREIYKEEMRKEILEEVREEYKLGKEGK
ncbi:MAG: hypothetical protein J6M62_06520 [Selenomonadaceae bacterium]|nr:hypothetical protein [Selenomonadaceae bacterium]MBP3723877.1 hypothetical protein [Selenomonadaceae bacterium]